MSGYNLFLGRNRRGFFRWVGKSASFALALFFFAVVDDVNHDRIFESCALEQLETLDSVQQVVDSAEEAINLSQTRMLILKTNIIPR